MKTDIILINGYVRTSRSNLPEPRALAVGNGRILAVGGNEEIRSLASSGTLVVNLGGRLVLPGFFDAHIHFFEWAMKRRGVKLDDAESLEELLKRVRKKAEKTSPGEWIFGQGWNNTDWKDPRMPQKTDLDEVAPDQPVLLWRCDMHLAATNSLALKRAKIERDTPDPPEGRIERDTSGEATGILRELAINLVRQAVPAPDVNDVITAFEEAAGALHQLGITAIHDVRLMDDSDGALALQSFQSLEQGKKLCLRTWVSLPGNTLDTVIGLGLRSGFGNDTLRIGHVKFFSDGGMGARTAWMIEPTLDAGKGMPLMDIDDLAGKIFRADAAGLSVMVHAVGDRANRELIGIFERLKNQKKPDGRALPIYPHRMEHVQMIRPGDAERLKNLGVALCLTPANMPLDINLIDAAVGKKGKFAYAFRRLIDTGAPAMFSSDCPVCDPNPLLGVHAAVTRKRPDGTPKNGWYPESKIELSEAIEAYTSTPAKIHGRPDIGWIVPGNRADLAVLNKNLFQTPHSRIPSTKVDMTLFDGCIVHRNF